MVVIVLLCVRVLCTAPGWGSGFVRPLPPRGPVYRSPGSAVRSPLVGPTLSCCDTCPGRPCRTRRGKPWGEKPPLLVRDQKTLDVLYGEDLENGEAFSGGRTEYRTPARAASSAEGCPPGEPPRECLHHFRPHGSPPPIQYLHQQHANRESK